MPSFTIKPGGRVQQAINLQAYDASHVLGLVERMGCGEADVLENGLYAFSLRLDPNGVWSIFRR